MHSYDSEARVPPNADGQAPCRYDAFVSYKRSDGAAFAERVRAFLVDYQIPEELQRAGIQQRQLSIYVDRAYERGGVDFFDRNIAPALLSSRWLIVVRTKDAMSPDRAGSWMEREISLFQNTQRRENVAGLLAMGMLDDAFPGQLRTTYPRLQVIDIRGFAPWRLGRRRPPAPDPKEAMLALVSSLYDIPIELGPQLRELDAKRRRAAERIRKTRLAWIVGAFVLVAVAAVMAILRFLDQAAARALEDGRRHAGRGQWTHALRAFDEAEQLGHDPVAVQLERIHVWDATQNLARARDALLTLSEHSNLGRHQALVDLLLSDGSRLPEGDAVDRKWRVAMTALCDSPDLSPAWQEYARACVASTIVGATTHIEAALRLDNRHRRAHELRLSLRLMTAGAQGALEAAREFQTLWASDPYGRTIEAAALQMLGRRQESEAILTDLGSESARSFSELAPGAARFEPGRVSRASRQTDPEHARRVQRGQPVSCHRECPACFA